MQSYLKSRTEPMASAEVAAPPLFLNGPITRIRQKRVLWAFGLTCLLSMATGLSPYHGPLESFALGLSFPGAGFLHWAGSDSSTQRLALLYASGAGTAFATALLLWFATGNVLLLPLVWIGAALLAGNPAMLGLDGRSAAILEPVDTVLPAILAFVAGVAHWRVNRWRAPPLPKANGFQRQYACPDPADEISLDQLKQLRLLLDRALQPVDQFNGFEWRDQFQTAAVRYQINFISYALSMAQRNFAPAATAYLAEAQRRLLLKQGDPRIWRYWAIENAWGNLRRDRDPIQRDNIMYSGFVAAQMAYAGLTEDLQLFDRQGEWQRYSLAEMTALLAEQYRGASYGLLPCEPNWIYPLCNMIAGSAVLACDRRMGRNEWSSVAQGFRENLTQEFAGPDGGYVAFRSALTGFGPARLGGTVMQALPCLFLNSLFPDLATAQWDHVRSDLAKQDWGRAFWPIDVGNYGLSRASSYAASAAAAVEMGDGDTARALLDRLEADCPAKIIGGVAHREKASLWAHALEMMALLGCEGGLRRIVNEPLPPANSGLHLSGVSYGDVLIGEARCPDRDTLKLVLHPAADHCRTMIEVSGLRPERHYRTGLSDTAFVKSDCNGEANIPLTLSGRTALHIVPVI